MASFTLVLGMAAFLSIGMRRTAAAGSAPATSPPHVTARTLSAWAELGGAVLSGFVNTDGHVGTFWFQYGTTKRYGHAAPTERNEEPVAPTLHGEVVEEAVDCLAPLTTYHFRVVGYSAGVKAFGRDRTFRTPRRAVFQPEYGSCPGHKPIR
jgi:hypothetical protein